MSEMANANKSQNCFEQAGSSVGSRPAYYRSTPFSDRDALDSGLFVPGMQLESISYCESQDETMTFIQLGLWKPQETQDNIHNTRSIVQLSPIGQRSQRDICKLWVLPGSANDKIESIVVHHDSHVHGITIDTLESGQTTLGSHSGQAQKIKFTHDQQPIGLYGVRDYSGLIQGLGFIVYTCDGGLSGAQTAVGGDQGVQEAFQVNETTNELPDKVVEPISASEKVSTEPLIKHIRQDLTDQEKSEATRPQSMAFQVHKRDEVFQELSNTYAATFTLALFVCFLLLSVCFILYKVAQNRKKKKQKQKEFNDKQGQQDMSLQSIEACKIGPNLGPKEDYSTTPAQAKKERASIRPSVKAYQTVKLKQQESMITLTNESAREESNLEMTMQPQDETPDSPDKRDSPFAAAITNTGKKLIE